MIRRLIQGACLGVFLMISFGAGAQTAISGEKKGAFYNIVVPLNWNGDLVIWNHGYDFNPPTPNPDLGPLAGLQLAQGYAVAASSYQQSQWAVFRTRKDIDRLIEIFEDKVGEPNSIIMNGASLGGIVTADSLERGDEVEDVSGAFVFCGAMAGSRVWDGALDIRLTYDAICGDVAPLPGGATGLPENPGIIDTFAVGLATNTCMGNSTPPEFRTAEQTERLNRFLAVTKIPENFINTDMVFATNGIANLTFDQKKLKGRKGIGNIGVTYDDPDVNANIQRVRPDRKGARKLKKNFTPKGDFEAEDVKIVSLHTDKDGLVLVENQKEYQEVVDSSQLSVGIVTEAVPTHCGFTEAELVGGWEALRGWLAGGSQPSAAVLQGTCLGVQGAGFAGPCRIDPTFVVPDMDGRIPPRGKKHRGKHDDDDRDDDDD